jgi:ABC-type transport system involved in multi-copper enzyme maturation permease subunit
VNARHQLPNLAVNPVLRRELVERMRGRGAFLMLTLYLAVLSVILYIAYQAGKSSGNATDQFGGPFGGGVDPTQIASVGRGIFEWLLFFMLVLVLFMVPGQVSGAIAGERERQTLIPLQITLLRPRSILLGKIGAALAFLMLLMVATLPLLAVTYLIGGVTIGDVLSGIGLVVFVGLVLGCVCASISAFVRRVQLATVLCYGVVLFLLMGTLLVRQAANVIDESRGTDEGNAPAWLLLPNPVATVAGVVGDGPDSFGVMESPFDWTERFMSDESSSGCDTVFTDNVGREICGETGEPIGEGEGGPPGGFWWQSAGLLGLFAVLAVVAGSRRLRTPTATER